MLPRLKTPCCHVSVEKPDGDPARNLLRCPKCRRVIRWVSRFSGDYLNMAIEHRKDDRWPELWTAQVDDLVGGWIVTTYPFPYAEHPDREHDSRIGGVDRDVISCWSEDRAKLVAGLLNEHKEAKWRVAKVKKEMGECA